MGDPKVGPPLINPEMSASALRYQPAAGSVSRGPLNVPQRCRRFKSTGQAQRFLCLHSVVQNLFRVGRHLLKSTNYRFLRLHSFSVWQTVTAA
jgi:putative transposase